MRAKDAIGVGAGYTPMMVDKDHPGEGSRDAYAEPCGLCSLIREMKERLVLLTRVFLLPTEGLT